MRTLLPKLAALLAGKDKLSSGVHKQIVSLRNEMGSMNALLVRLSRAAALDEQQTDWRDKVRELSYDMEDCVDVFTHDLNGGGHGGKAWLRRRLRKIKTRHKIASRVEELKARALQVSSCHQVIALELRLSLDLEALSDIYQAFRGWMPSSLKDGQLIVELRNYLRDKRYLIVLDDIWAINAWNTFKVCFVENNLGSRVITTTRNEDVAKACCSCFHGHVYRIKPLNDLDSRRLFYKRVFYSDEACPKQLKNVSGEILKKCDGVPLAILSVASYLASHEEVSSKETWEKMQNHLGFPLEGHPAFEWMRHVLTLGYNDLSLDLKTCLLYLGIFPQGSKIRKENLVKRWISEGFVTQKHGYGPEDIAESYFSELINKNMIQIDEYDDCGHVLSCRVHDLMLDFIILKSTEENFITVIKEPPTGVKLFGAIGRMKALCTLVGFFILRRDVKSMKALGALSNLRELELYLEGPFVPDSDSNSDSVYDSLLLSLNRLGRLQSITFHGLARYSYLEKYVLTCWSTPPPSHLHRLHAQGFTFSIVPDWVAQLNQLRSLKIEVRSLLGDGLEVTARLTMLVHLELYVREHVPIQGLLIRAATFPNLKEFWFRYKAPCLMFEAGAMPRVQSLTMECYAEAERQGDDSVLDGIEHLGSLETFKVYICRQENFSRFLSCSLPVPEQLAHVEEINRWDERSLKVMLRKAINKHPGSPDVSIEPA
ncbi:disease resistance protein rpp13 [Hordeum vulgare]|nr:disease resistance protein rpp13 [Hordeum vulgare]